MTQSALDMQKSHDAYWNAVEAGSWPASRRVPLPEAFRNASGEIRNLSLRPVTSVASIFSLAGSTRANHYHKTDWHFTYVVSGSVVYFERPVGSVSKPLDADVYMEVFHAGEMFFTPPMVEHCMLFASDSVIVTLAKNVRSHESHESDVVRVSFVSKEDAEAFLRRYRVSARAELRTSSR